MKYEQGIADFSKELISGNQNALANGLGILARASDADSAFFYKNFKTEDDSLRAGLVHWNDVRNTQLIPSSQRLREIDYDACPGPWKRELGGNLMISVDRSSGSDKEGLFLDSIHLESLLLMPVFSGDHWQGFIGIGSTFSTDPWRETVIRLMKIASAMIGSYLEKEFYISALIKSEERYRSIIENIFEGYFETDLKGIFTFVNENLCKMHKRTRQEFLGMSYRDITDPETAMIMKKCHENVYKTGIPYNFGEYVIIRKDGTIGTHEHSVSLIEDAQGVKKGFRGIVRDVGERKKHEEMQKRFNASCFELQKLESIATLAGGLAHDFNNLLMGIQGNTSLIMAKCNPDEYLQQKIENIEKCIQSGSEITHQLLGFARGGKYQVEPLQLNATISSVLELFGRSRKDIRIVTSFASDLMTVQGDSGQLDQIFLNLFLNAAHAMKQGGKLEVSTANVHVDDAFAFLNDAEAGDYVRVVVSDTGMGMDEQTRKRIFEPFFTTREMGNGTGLGLASVYGIVKNHSGIITVDSEEGKGTTFMLFFPASTEQILSPGTPPSIMSAHPRTILLVDDERMVLDITKEILQALGYNVLSAQSGMEAVELYRKNKNLVDLVMMDVVMPDMSGFEASRKIMEVNASAVILFLSGYPADHEVIGHVTFDEDRFIKKPFTMAQLKEKISIILET